MSKEGARVDPAWKGRNVTRVGLASIRSAPMAAGEQQTVTRCISKSRHIPLAGWILPSHVLPWQGNASYLHQENSPDNCASQGHSFAFDVRWGPNRPAPSVLQHNFLDLFIHHFIHPKLICVNNNAVK